jgi:hypothetical protein
MGELMRSRSTLTALSYLGAVLAAAIALSLPAQSAALGKLLAAIASPLVPALLILPLIAGGLILWFSRRFWTWPFAYLTAFYVVFSGMLVAGEQRSVDEAFEYARIITLTITVLVAELVGLFLGRLGGRLLGMAFFGGAALWLLLAAAGRIDGGVLLSGRNAVSFVAGIGFALQAYLQLAKHLAKLQAEREGVEVIDDDASEEELAAYVPVIPPRPTVNDGALPWKVVIGEEPKARLAAAEIDAGKPSKEA